MLGYMRCIVSAVSILRHEIVFHVAKAFFRAAKGLHGVLEGDMGTKLYKKTRLQKSQNPAFCTRRRCCSHDECVIHKAKKLHGCRRAACGDKAGKVHKKRLQKDLFSRR